MTPSHVISELLKSDAKHLNNILLLKKIMRAASLGRLQINGCSPDNQIPFGHYLFDNERMLFDFTRLSDAKKDQFKKWLLFDHQKEKEKNYYSESSVNEYRGFAAEEPISWLGRIKRWTRREYTEQWKIKDIEISLNYQLLGMDLCHGQHGILIGFQQLLVPSSLSKYKSEDDPQPEPLGNTKRVIFTDNLVDRLIKTNLRELDFDAISKGPHPLAIDVPNSERRYKAMHEYRNEHNYTESKPWYVRLWNWVLSWFQYEPVKQTQANEPAKKNDSPRLKPLQRDETTTIYKNGDQGILVKEIRPTIENLVYCGGGSKIFAHVGVWKALNDKKIVPKKFAGSSAGAVMGLMCYLGYKADQIAELFKDFRHEHLVYFNLDSRGISKADALKTALDYAIALKVEELVTRHGIPYPEGPITFATLEALRLRCPDSGFGEALIVTATNKQLSTTRYFSLQKSPDMEVSETVKISASVPILFRATNLDGEDYNDGGVLNNFPTEAFHGDNTTFLESVCGNNLKTLAVQFDNGTERATIDRIKDPVHKEHFLLNWILGIMAGVRDPASGWEQDRLKLRKYAPQSIIVNVDNISSTDFSVEEETQKKLIANGEHAANAYFQSRYADKGSELPKSMELMHENFSSLEELLAYCCYIGNEARFHSVRDLIEHSSMSNKEVLLERAKKLKELYFSALNQDQNELETPHSLGLFGNKLKPMPLGGSIHNGHKPFLALYPVILKLSAHLIKNPKEHDLLSKARHSFKKDSLFVCLNYLTNIKDEIHIVFHMFIELVKALENELKKPRKNESGVECYDESKVQKIYTALKMVEKLLGSKTDVFKSRDLYGIWNITLDQGIEKLYEIDRVDSGFSGLKGSCDLLRKSSKKEQAAKNPESPRMEQEFHTNYVI